MRYETKQHQRDEERIAKAFATHTKTDCLKLGPPGGFGRLDYALCTLNGRPRYDSTYIRAVFEVKKKAVRFDKYPTIYVALDKMKALEDAATILGVDSYIVHEYLEGIFYARVGCTRSYDELYPPCSYNVIETRKREDRGGGWQYVVDIPAREWQRISADRHGAKQMQSGAWVKSDGAVNAV